MRTMLALGLGACAVVACRHPDDHDDQGVLDVDAAVIPHARVATFNVRRLFDTVCESGSCSGDDYELLLTPAELATRTTVLAGAIRALDADVIALQEIESQECLDALLARLPEMPYGVLGEINTTASVDVAIFSRLPITSVIGHRDAEPLTLPDGTITAFSRELLEVHTQIADGTELIMFAAHFKSKASDDPPRRLAEAQVAARVVSEVGASNPDALVVLGGDLNDTPGSPPLNALTVDGALVRAASDLPDEEQATYDYRGRGQAIDHLLFAPTSAAQRLLPQSSRAWQGSSRGWGDSDHRALTTDIALRP